MLHPSSSYFYKISQIETAEIETKVLEGLRHGNEALKALQKELSIEDVEAVMEDARELQQWASVRGFFFLLIPSPLIDVIFKPVNHALSVGVSFC